MGRRPDRPPGALMSMVRGPEGVLSRPEVIARNAAALLGANAVTWSLSLLYILLVPRHVGDSQWGEWSLAGAITTIATLALALGIEMELLKEVARDRPRAEAYAGAALAARLLLAIPLVLIVAGFSVAAGYGFHTLIVIAVLTCTSVVNHLMSPVSAVLQAMEKMHLNALTKIIDTVLVSGISIVLVTFFAFDVIALCVVALIGTVVSSAVRLAWLGREIPLRIHFDWPLIRRLIIGGIPYWIGGFFLVFYVDIDGVLLSRMSPTRVVGWYSAAYRLISLTGFLPAVVVSVVLPGLAHAFTHDRAAMRRLAQRSFTLVTSLSLPMVAGLALLGPAAVRLLYGHDFEPAAPVLLIVSFTLTPIFIATLVNAFLIAEDRQAVWTYVMGAMCIINPAINLLTIPYFQRVYGNGALGAAWAVLATDMLVGGAALWLMPRGLLGSPRAVLGPIFRAGIATAIMAGVVWPLREVFVPLREVFVLVPLGAGIVVFVGAAVALRVFTPDDLALVGTMGVKIARRLRSRRGADLPDDQLPVTAAGEQTKIGVG